MISHTPWSASHSLNKPHPCCIGKLCALLMTVIGNCKASSRARFNDLLNFGRKNLSFAKISQQLKTSKPTLIAWARELQIDIHNCRGLEADAIREKYRLSALQRLELFGQMLSKLEKEFKTRNLDSLPTDKLIELMMKLANVVERDCPPINFQEEQTKTLEDSLMEWQQEKVIKEWEA